MPSRQRNVFMVYMPQGNPEAMAHYRDTVENRVPLSRVAPFLSASIMSRLKSVFDGRPMAIWGSRDGPGNRRQFSKMEEGDELLIVEGKTIKFMGKVALKVESPDLSRELWKNLQGTSTAGWDLIYFIANPVEIGIPFSKFCELLGYQRDYQLRGFSSVSDNRLAEFYDRYDDLHSILIRARDGREILTRPTEPVLTAPPPPASEILPEEIERVLNSEIVSDHVKMQFKLARLGIKAGEKVWVPAADQEKLRRVYDFDEFEQTFTRALDMPPNYVENIDVVWKEEFRIDAAFEVENSTAIYSGLLRFADLSIMAPNTIYPMFIVAPVQRRNQVRSQLMRPSFQRLKIREKVLFLPYETIDEIDRFFERSETGLSVELIRGKAETLA
jgi:hypothetical protein